VGDDERTVRAALGNPVGTITLPDKNQKVVSFQRGEVTFTEGKVIGFSLLPGTQTYGGLTSKSAPSYSPSSSSPTSPGTTNEVAAGDAPKSKPKKKDKAAGKKKEPIPLDPVKCPHFKQQIVGGKFVKVPVEYEYDEDAEIWKERARTGKLEMQNFDGFLLYYPSYEKKETKAEEKK